MKSQTTCPCCGHKVTSFTHALNSGLGRAFVAMVEAYLATSRPININTELELTHNQIANFQKLRYFGLVKSIERLGWVPTTLGLAFYYGEVKIYTPAASRGNVPLADTDPAWLTQKKPRKLVNLADVLGGPWAYKQRPQYQAEKSPQQTLPLAPQGDTLFT